MGLFEKAGRRFEQFKQQAADTAEESAEYECTACETRLFTSRDACPECGADAVVPIDTSDAEGTDAEGTDDRE